MYLLDEDIMKSMLILLASISDKLTEILEKLEKPKSKK